jgi:hypothetical protein
MGFWVATTKERLRQRIRLPADRHLALLHGLEQGRLRLGRRTVDLVGEQEVREHRAGQELQRVPAGGGVFLDDVRAGDVSGHQVGRELHPAELHRQRARQGPSHQGLA